MKKVCFIPFFAVAPLFFAGCGDDVATTTVNETTVVEEIGISQLAKGEAFPECSEENGGEMLYAADSGFIYVCMGKSWVSLGGESSADTVVIRDTLLQKDSVFLSQNDTVVVKDTLVLKDSLIFKDTLILSNVDTVVISNVDTLVVRDTLVGLDGKSCTAEMLADSSGYKIICGDDSVGVVLNGSEGKNGIDGKNGVGCTAADSGNGVVLIQCAADTVELYKAVCGTTPYDPLQKFCSDGKLYSCDGKPYDPVVSFCYKDTIVTRCGTRAFDLALRICDRRDNQLYKTTTIGTQTWMAQNLNYRYTQGTASLDSSSFCYENDTSNCRRYGRLYTWSAAIDSAGLANDGENPLTCGYSVRCSLPDTVRGICPEGWHLPTLAEFNTLVAYAGGESLAGKMLKATSGGWSNGGNGSDAYGFSALPVGYRDSDGNFYNAGNYAFFWSATESTEFCAPEFCAHYMDLESDYDVAGLLYKYKGYASSVRCVKDSD